MWLERKQSLRDAVFLGERLAVKIGDFGLSNKLAPGELATKPVGSKEFMAPEIWACKNGSGNGYGLQADIWALGCILYEMCEGSPAPGKIYAQDENLHVSEEYSEDLRQVIADCLRKRPQDRADIAQLKNHTIVKLMLAVDKTMRDLYPDTAKQEATSRRKTIHEAGQRSECGPKACKDEKKQRCKKHSRSFKGAFREHTNVEAEVRSVLSRFEVEMHDQMSTQFTHWVLLFGKLLGTSR